MFTLRNVARTFPLKNARRNLASSGLKSEFDVVVIGAGAMGASTSYWLKHFNKNISVIVIDKDYTYKQCSTSLSVGGIRQQFSLPENIQLSLYGAEFIKTLTSRFGPDANIGYTPNGYLIISSADGVAHLERNCKTQNELGAKIALLSQAQLKSKFPWLNVSGVEMGALGVDKEGWFDPYALLTLFKTSASEMGAKFLTGTVSNITADSRQVRTVHVTPPSGGPPLEISCKFCVLAAGAESGHVASFLDVPLPVERRKRFVYRFGCQDPDPPGEESPLFIDYTGAYFRRDGKWFIGGQAPSEQQEPQDTDNLEVDFDFFDQVVWPNLAHRVPAFNNIKVVSAWAGFYEFNTFDENGIIGAHDFYRNLLFATGFSGHGIQQSPAVGRAVAELILSGCYKTINLEKLGFERFQRNEPMYEQGIY